MFLEWNFRHALRKIETFCILCRVPSGPCFVNGIIEVFLNSCGETQSQLREQYGVYILLKDITLQLASSRFDVPTGINRGTFLIVFGDNTFYCLPQ